MREIQRGREDLHDEHRSKRQALDHIDAKIMFMLEKTPFESARSIVHALNVDHATVLHHLGQKLGLKSYCLRWAPHLLTDELRANRKNFVGLMIPYLEAARTDGWKHLVTAMSPSFSLCVLLVACGLCSFGTEKLFDSSDVVFRHRRWVQAPIAHGRRRLRDGASASE
jgi:hypothetical protein